MFVVVALVSAACYGAADFLGGLTSKRANTLAIVIVSQLSGLVLLAAMLPFVPEARVTNRDVFWGAASGLTGGIGVAMLYRALAVGTMAVVAPVTAVCAVVIPVAAAVLLGERPGALTMMGMVVAVIAIVLLSRAETSIYRGHPSGIGLAFAAGIAIGLFFLCLARTGREAGLWPLVFARLVSVPFFAVMALAARRTVAMPLRVATIAATGGALDMVANLLYLIATRLGPLSVVVTLSSLYPASTVLLARLSLGERLTTSQAIGVACAIAAVAAIVSSTA